MKRRIMQTIVLINSKKAYFSYDNLYNICHSEYSDTYKYK